MLVFFDQFGKSCSASIAETDEKKGLRMTGEDVIGVDSPSKLLGHLYLVSKNM